MNVKTVRILAVWAIIMLTAFSASAADNQLAASIGLKGWYVTDWTNKWHNPGGAEHSWKSSSNVFMMGPSVKISYGKFFTGMNFMTAMTDFELSENGGLRSKSDRQDVDFMLGYAPFSWLSVTGGYKRINASESATSTATTAAYATNIAAGGPVVGLGLNYRIGNLPVVLYANGAYMFLKGQAWGLEVDAKAYSAEGGLTYIPVPYLSLSLGYKYQVIPWSNDIAGTETVTGATMAIDYRF
jgi:hypothetical protein